MVGANTPGTKIPSHGTDKFGQTYAFDFLQVNWTEKKRMFLMQAIFGIFYVEFHWKNVFVGGKTFIHLVMVK